MVERPLVIVLQADHVTISRGQNPVLHDVEFELQAASVVAVVGVSGSGKTSLLQCLAGLIPPDKGRILYRGTRLDDRRERYRRRVRLREFGFVFQFGELLPELTLVENVELPLRFADRNRRQARPLALEVMDQLSIAHLADRRPGEVSGGEQQRAAIARALVHEPSVVFADEPTGSLDEDHSQMVAESFLTVAQQRGAAVVLASHDRSVTRQAGATYTISSHRLHHVDAVS